MIHPQSSHVPHILPIMLLLVCNRVYTQHPHKQVGDRALLKCFSVFSGTDLLQDLSKGSMAHGKLAALAAQQRKDIDHALKCECQTTCSHTDNPHTSTHPPIRAHSASRSLSPPL